MDVKEFIELESAKERFMGNEELFKSFLFEFPERDLYFQLKEALDKEDVEEAFQVAHKMKGIIQNLSLNQLGRTIEYDVEILRGGKLLSQEDRDVLEKVYTSSMDNIRQIKESNIELF